MWYVDLGLWGRSKVICGMCGFDNLVKGLDLDYYIFKEFVLLKRYMYNKLNEVFFL